ncbi:helix-turn-helix transcriptional regulator [Merismopedia glauca]|uniref:WYL domain-containing protein n=1 Tax=Merismopedia glauca CCAP 1448/3 TaxID=1296344 RepID=A0A2T1C0P9_9CYAN|nr:WYL domain-containing protein [Merismopedia glauca]PSB01846.1 WYL domain-containing protein [Merismopedia glauca CCAP 1448/3]
MSRKGQSITLSISDRDKQQLETLAVEFGMKWGEKPNISKLVEAIARRQLQISPNHDWTQPRIKALSESVRALLDVGQVENSQLIAKLLLERSELSLPLRQEIEELSKRLASPWRLEIETYIRRQQPFQLSYQDAAERLWKFSIHYAEIANHEENIYLDCWCEETEGNQDLQELQHNWSLRLDRITEANITPINSHWRGKLASILVEMHLINGLAYAYRAKTEDETVTWLETGIRKVERKVSHSFWFIREVMRYTPDCIIVSPESVRSSLKQKLLSLCTLYHIDTVEPEKRS